MLEITRFAVAVLLSSFVGCQHATELRDQFVTSGYTLPLKDRLQIELAAPVIYFADSFSMPASRSSIPCSAWLAPAKSFFTIAAA